MIYGTICPLSPGITGYFPSAPPQDNQSYLQEERMNAKKQNLYFIHIFYMRAVPLYYKHSNNIAMYFIKKG